jgi:hypothetical protein
LKELITQETGLPAQQQRMIFWGRQLENERYDSRSTTQTNTTSVCFLSQITNCDLHRSSLRDLRWGNGMLGHFLLRGRLTPIAHMFRIHLSPYPNERYYQVAS